MTSEGGNEALIVMVEPGYISLAQVLRRALDQAQAGKGKERHSTGEPFDEQQIVVLGRWLGSTDFQVGQAVKKAIESKRLPTTKAVAELLGAINYLAAAVIVLEDELPLRMEFEYDLDLSEVHGVPEEVIEEVASSLKPDQWYEVVNAPVEPWKDAENPNRPIPVLPLDGEVHEVEPVGFAQASTCGATMSDGGRCTLEPNHPGKLHGYLVAKLHDEDLGTPPNASITRQSGETAEDWEHRRSLAPDNPMRADAAARMEGWGTRSAKAEAKLHYEDLVKAANRTTGDDVVAIQPGTTVGVNPPNCSHGNLPPPKCPVATCPRSCSWTTLHDGLRRYERACSEHENLFTGAP